MKIVALDAFNVRIPLRRPVRHASHRRTETDNVVVRCELDDGTVGHGEGVPRDYVTGETADTALDLLGRAKLRERRARNIRPCFYRPRMRASKMRWRRPERDSTRKRKPRNSITQAIPALASTAITSKPTGPMFGSRLDSPIIA